MYVRNVLKSGDYFIAVPIGIPVTLQYSEKGNLEKLYLGFAHQSEYASEDMMKQFVESQTGPIHIALPGGTTWIQGVLYTSEEVFKSCPFGPITTSCINEMMELYLSDASKYKFYACAVDTMATQFHGPVAIRQWLLSASFSVLPGWLVPANLNKERFIDMIQKTVDLPYNPNLIAAYVIYRADEVECVDTELASYYVKQVNKVYSDDGTILGQLQKDSKNYINVPYSEVVSYNIQPNSCVILDKYHNVIYCSSLDKKKRENRSNKLTCSVCGSVISVPLSGDTMCPNTRCASRMKSRITNMLSNLNLPSMSDDVFEEITEGCKGNVLLSRVFYVEPYKSMKLELSIVQILRAIIPIDSRISDDTLSSFAGRCNHSVDSVLHFVDHPDKIAKQLGMEDFSSNCLIKWFSDDSNKQEIHDIFDCISIHVIADQKKFEGAPIFRGKKILPTGTFSHGSIDDVEAILRSYSAEIAQDKSEASCILVGDIKENINGSYLQYARRNNIPIFEESVFFAKYEIDEDLSENL